MIGTQIVARFAVLGILWSSLAQAAPTVCVLSYLPKSDRIAGAVAETFRYAPEAKVFTEAVPMDIVNCINEGFTQIIIVAHAIEMKNDDSSKVIRMGYFEPAQNSVSENQKQAYALKLFYNQIFKVADQALSAREASGQDNRLKEIRLMACAPQQISAAYPSFESLIKNHSLKLDTAPSSFFLDLFSDVPVTTFNRAWMAKSVSCKNAVQWRTNGNSFCKADYWPGCNRDEALWCVPTAPQ